VIANGDITDAASAAEALRLSGADGVMIGRGARGRPWQPGQIAARLNGRTPAADPAGAALLDLIAGHYEAILGFYGRDLGLRVARKHLGWYLARIAGAEELRRALMVETEPATVLRLLRHGLGGGDLRVAA
jgi:tRNA-dihydrouridine synthase